MYKCRKVGECKQLNQPRSWWNRVRRTGETKKSMQETDARKMLMACSSILDPITHTKRSRIRMKHHSWMCFSGFNQIFQILSYKSFAALFLSTRLLAPRLSHILKDMFHPLLLRLHCLWFPSQLWKYKWLGAISWCDVALYAIACLTG